MRTPAPLFSQVLFADTGAGLAGWPETPAAVAGVIAAQQRRQNPAVRPAASGTSTGFAPNISATSL